jgi:1,5-anhydro-D-fructose reductase (1,5-anhydro-D-mannitol-forming)
VNISFFQPNAVNPKKELPWRVLPEIAGGGIFVDMGSHMLDFLDFVLGPIESVAGFAANHLHLYPAEDIVTGTFEFPSGVVGTATWCFSASEKIDRTEIVGSKGIISYSTFDAHPVTLKTSAGSQEFIIGYPEHIQQPFIQVVVNALNGIGTSPSTGETGLRTTWVMEQMIKNYYGT